MNAVRFIPLLAAILLGIASRRPAPRPGATGPPSKSGTSDLLKMDIDHVMVSHKLVASAAEVIDAGASDHRPVVVTIAPK